MSCREPERHHWSAFCSSWPGNHYWVGQWDLKQRPASFPVHVTSSLYRQIQLAGK